MQRDRIIVWASVALCLVASCLLDGFAVAQPGTPEPCPSTVTHHWDAVLARNFVVTLDCDHPERPAHSVLEASSAHLAAHTPVVDPSLPFVVHAGDTVKLWQQTATVRIETTGAAEQTARVGDTTLVRLTHRTDDGSVAIDHVQGVVHGAGDVEMAR